MSLTNRPWGRTLHDGGRLRSSAVQAQAESYSRAASEHGLLTDLRTTQELETLVRGLSHRFNNDLHIIGGHAKLIAGGTVSSVQAEASADIIRCSLQRMERTFKDVLLCALSGHAELSVVDVAAHLAGLRATLEQLAPGGIELHIEAEYPLPALASGALLTESLVHLVRNGIEAALKGPAQVHVRCGQIELGQEDLHGARPTSNSRPGSYACIEVRDEGRGIPGVELERIFDPFSTSKLMRRGLGLPRVLCNVRRMGGLITLQSTLREGTCVRLYLQTSAAHEPMRCDDDLPLSALFAGC